MRKLLLPIALLVFAGMLQPVRAATTGEGPLFSVGAASVGIAPPLYDRATNPADCDPAGAFDGYRKFNLEEPYKDQNGNGQFDVGEPFLDCNHNGRFDGIFVTSNDDAQNAVEVDPIQARAFVVSNGRKKIAVEVIDSIGIFNTEYDAIRGRIPASLGLDEIFISSTHDESAPDPVGLWGPSSGVSGVSSYYLDFLAQKGAEAIEQADAARKDAHIRYADVEQPSRFQTCFSSYPYVQDRKLRVMQAVDAATGAPILTLSNYGIHAETMSFSPDAAERHYMSADWPHFERAKLDADLGGISIHMAGAIGSVETPRVFDSVTPAPTVVAHPDHPADCRTTDTGQGTLVPLGYDKETRAVGEVLAQTVEDALAREATWATSDDIAFAREKFSMPLTNVLFLGVAPAGLFATRPLCAAGTAMPVLPNGTTAGNELCTEVAAYTIGDAEFMSAPGEVFPYVIIRGFQGAQDMPYPNDTMSAWVMPHASKPYRFIEGLGEDMTGYLFSQNNSSAVPEPAPERGTNIAGGDDRFTCSHDDDGEAPSGNGGAIVADHMISVLERIGSDSNQSIETGRYVMNDGSLSRNPVGTGPLRCDVSSFTLAPGDGAVAARIWHGTTSENVVPAGFIDSDGRPQAHPNMSTRGIWVPGNGEATFTEGVSKRIWLDVFPELPSGS